ncbi:DUF2969 domain-containing protein [Lentilactobacillus parakefiri]|uniref:DUF2969 domain-containing protein n=1 Tax=Lentilactobacillus parakefiri TaxID=152332 RepID=A0A269YPE4_9LACO|nr:DUF2969 domain-containing protein [Lentilactobacillus parakefiri]PAK87437.1 hypothetical protein B8W98_01255 [Lentilactobacillus parakefiri]PAK99744.1 hypothetical protein B8W96_10015 [Lentilactobacillus parakefiri]TDG87560.1 hypothetical protein C5L28_002268 [Lentilactobacillus parakefiri]GAW71286.1 hypothetical protein LPKJCM_00366 [Lentilactobacillus parakefiri]
MSKANKSINVEIKDRTDQSGESISELFIGKKLIGSIKQLSADKFQAVNTHDEEFHVKNFDEGVTQLIKDFHLHH